MTDSHHGSRQLNRRVNVSTVQIGASAAAAVTSALAASFFGVAGTLIGAAVGSIVSTVAGALYVDYLKRAGARIRVTRSIVVQRATSNVSIAGPADITGSARPAGAASPAGAAEVAGGRPWYRRPVVALPAVGAAGFLIALAVVTISEGALGGPWSGGKGGTSVSDVFRDKGSPANPRSTPKAVTTSTGTPVTTQPSPTTQNISPAGPAPSQPTRSVSTAPSTQPTTTPVETVPPSASSTSPVVSPVAGSS